MSIEELIGLIKKQPEKVEFDHVVDVIDDNYEYTPTHFRNGKGHDLVNNLSGSNEGSCKIFAFATMHGLNETETLACFGKYYRVEVLEHPKKNNHANIRTFIRHGWSGIQFEGTVLI